MTNTVQDYLDLVTSEYRNQPDFMATVSFKVALQVQVQTLLASMIPIFDLSLPPVGNQLDIIGEWAGVSRNVSIPITDAYFSWDDHTANAYDGWDFGTWNTVPPAASITVLPDDAYLNLILAKIAANNWDGTTEGAYIIWSQIFPQFEILIQDLNNMTYNLAIIGGIVDAVTVALITGGYIPLRPEGVEVANYYVSVDANPGFAWDTENDFLAGWDQASWLRVV